MTVADTTLEFDTVIGEDYSDTIIVRRGVRLTVQGNVYRPISVKEGGSVVVYGHADTLILNDTAKCYVFGTCRQLTLRNGSWWGHSVHICGGCVEHVHLDGGTAIVSGGAYVKEMVIEPGRLIAMGRARIDDLRMNRMSYLRLRKDTAVRQIKASQGAEIELKGHFTSIRSFKQNHQLKRGVVVLFRD